LSRHVGARKNREYRGRDDQVERAKSTLDVHDLDAEQVAELNGDNSPANYVDIIGLFT
jgi:hypothetical protein